MTSRRGPGADIIRAVPYDVIAAIDVKAQRLGLSRDDYLRRTLARERNIQSSAVSVDDLAPSHTPTPIWMTRRSCGAPGDEGTGQRAAYFLRTPPRD